MSGFSRSSNGRGYNKGNYGGSHYQKKGGFLSNLLGGFGSGSNSGGGFHNQRNQYQNNTGYPNQNHVSSNELICKKCNSVIPAGSKFCLECGEKVLTDGQFCMNCGEKLPPNAKFCLKCGTKL